ncbi:MAG TPA: hypothetical protein VJ835_02285 [Fimbriimonadaceae bacterium]|nr:hypothetical protein [Fimbriimonadaceae bacterium]
MKKRKPPIVLATCLVLMLVAVAILYRPHSDTEEQVAPPPSAEQGERPAVSTNDVASMASGAMKATAEGGPKRPGMPGEESGPSIQLHKVQPTKPKPNESSTSTQWYTDQTRK